MSGLKWGSLLGSPDSPDPVLIWEKMCDSLVAALVPLPSHNDLDDLVFGISDKSCLLVQYNQEKQKGKLKVLSEMG